MVPRLPDSWSNWNLELLVFKERGKPEHPEKTSRRKGENQQQTQPTYGVHAGIRTRTTLVGGECSHHCVTLAPQIKKKFIAPNNRVRPISIVYRYPDILETNFAAFRSGQIIDSII